MSARDKDERRVHRLLDIVVEEVSLVDRAENKHRFVIVKRSDEMDETTNDTGDTQSQEEHSEEQTNAEDTEGAAGEEQTSEQATGGQETEALGVALEALEGLTEAVETLHALDDEQAGPRLTEIAGQLQSASERLTTLAGQPAGEGEGAGSQQQEGSGVGGGNQDGKDGKDLASVLAAVRDTLQRVGSLMDAGGEDSGAGQEGASDKGGGQDDLANTGGEAGQGKGKLADEIRALADAVRGQQQRLARLEKRAGLPNSAPTGELPPRRGPDDEDVGWPMDLNRPCDRESVDKSVSFHDV